MPDLCEVVNGHEVCTGRCHPLKDNWQLEHCAQWGDEGTRIIRQGRLGQQ